MLVIAGDSAPAGGAAFSEIAAATGGAAVITTALVFIGFAHRNGKISWLRRLGDYFAARSGMPAWAAIPAGLAAASLICALFGMLWDISLHIDDGRDPGPLANPAHYFILAGLFGTFTSGFLSIVLAEGRTSKAAIRLAPNWHVPLGGVLLTAAGGFALFGFPLDDVWHRLFGQDVTLWGPTHLMLIGGAGLSLIGIQTLLVEAKAPLTASGEGSTGGALERVLDFFYAQRAAMACGGLLLGMSVFQGEYDFGVQQFREVFHPVLIVFAAGIALVCARIYGGAGTALKGTVFFLIVRGAIALLVGPILGEATPHFPLYVVEALCVEAAAVAIAPAARPYLFATVSGLLLATVGFAAEYAWSHVWMPIEWPSRLVGEAVVLVPLTAVAASLIGAFVGSALRSPLDVGGARLPRPAVALVSVVAICAVVYHGLDTSPQQGVRGQVALTPAGNGRVNATVRVTPASAAKDADWVNITSWQGKQGKLVVDKLRPVGGGVYRSTQPIPVTGTWKTLVRIHKGDSLLGLPVYLPEDSAIPAKEVPARPQFARPFVADRTILQREAKQGVSNATWNVAYAIIGVIFAALIGLMGWSMVRLAQTEGGQPSSPRRRVTKVSPSAA